MTNDPGRHEGSRSWKAIVILGALVLITETYLVAGRAVGLPRTPLNAASFLVDGLSKGHRVSQTMKLGAGGFNEIRLRASPLGETYSGELTWALYEVGIIEGEERFLYRDVIPARVAIREATFAFRFPVIDESAGRWYRLDIWMEEANPQNGIGLWATDGRWSGGGSMFINDQSAFAELVFETRAIRATVWARLRHHFSGLGLVGLVLLAACTHGAFFIILHALMTMPPQSSIQDSVP